MLTRKFGQETVNYFSGNPLNRLAFLRQNHQFLSNALLHPTTRILLLNNLDPLSISSSELAFVSYDDVNPLIENPFEKSHEDTVAAFDGGVEDEQGNMPIVVFLGVDEKESMLNGVKGGEGVHGEVDEKDQSDVFSHGVYRGRAYFSVDVGSGNMSPTTTTTGEKKRRQKVAEEIVEAVTKSGNAAFKNSRLNLKLSPEHAGILAMARSLTDWNNRNRFCASCGQRTMSTNSGAKRSCPPTDKGKPRAPCPTREGIHNIAFPRTDPTVIMAIISSDGKSLLLGRQKRYPKYWYSCLAGFIEQGESVEDAVRRETWEEAGVEVGRVVIHSTQPWPFPASLMLGCIGEAVDKGEKISLENDPELESARWFSLDEVREALKTTTSSLTDPPPPEYKEGNLRLPPQTAIANQLLVAVVRDEFHLSKI